MIDVSGGDKIPRKGGPGISQSDLLIINKVRIDSSALRIRSALSLMTRNQTDLAPYVGASLDVMRRDSAAMREGGPTLFTSVRNGEGVSEVMEGIVSAWKVSGAAGKGKGKTIATHA